MSLNDIIVSIDNEKYQNYIQQTHSEENSNKDKISDETQITYLLFRFYENLQKRFYKKTIKEINSITNGQNIDEYNKAWKIFIIRIRAQLKVIKKKIEKYLIRYVEKIKLKHKIISIRKYLNQVLENLIIFVEKFAVSKKEEETEKVDNILRCYFEYIYLYCLFNKKIGNIIETITYLSNLVILYNETELIVKSDHTLFQLEKCFLLLCQMLISNRDHELGITYIDLTTKICLEHLIYNIKDLSDGVFIDDKKKAVVITKKKEYSLLNKNEQQIELEKLYGDKNIKKIIIHLVILFYYRGICYENIGKINFAIKSYYQCLWFINNFFYHSVLKISSLIKNTLERSLEVKRSIDYINRRTKFYDRIQYFLKKQIEKKKTQEENKDIMYENLLNVNKLKKLENKLLNLNINEVDTVNPFDVKKNVKELNGRKREGIYKNIFMSDRRLYNSYLREDFRQIIDSMDKIKTFDIDLVTREKIQKFLRGIYFEQSLKKFKEKNKLKNIKTYYTTNISKNKQRTSSILLMKYNQSRTLNKNNSLPNTFRKIRTHINEKEKISTTITKRNIVTPNAVFRLTQVHTSKNCSKSFANQVTNKTMRPKSSILGKTHISDEAQKKKRIFTPISTARNHFDYKSKTILTPIEKQKAKGQKLYEIKKGSKSLRAQSVQLFKRVPKENKNLNKFFNKNYLRKRNYIKMLEDRDLKFQKCILKIKKGQKQKNEILTKEIMKQNANELFERVIGVYLTSPTNLKENRVTNVDKDSKLDQKLQDALISSLDNAAIIKYNIQKDRERNKRRPMTEQMISNVKDVNLMNKNIIKEIDNKLEEIKKREIIENKNYRRFIDSNSKSVKPRKQNKKNNIRDKIKSVNISPNYRNMRSQFGYENFNNKEHYFYDINGK